MRVIDDVLLRRKMTEVQEHFFPAAQRLLELGTFVETEDGWATFRNLLDVTKSLQPGYYFPNEVQGAIQHLTSIDAIEVQWVGAVELRIRWRYAIPLQFGDPMETAHNQWYPAPSQLLEPPEVDHESCPRCNGSLLFFEDRPGEWLCPQCGASSKGDK